MEPKWIIKCQLHADYREKSPSTYYYSGINEFQGNYKFDTRRDEAEVFTDFEKAYSLGNTLLRRASVNGAIVERL